MEVAPGLLDAEKPDAVIIATGATPVKPSYIAGADQANVLTAWDIHEGPAAAGETVLVFSEWRGQAAVGAAEILADQGRRVEIVTPMMFVGQDIDPLSISPTYEKLLEKGVVFTPQRALVRIDGNAVTLLNIFSQQIEIREGIDTVVLSTPAKANNALYFALAGKVAELYRAGDCVAPRLVASAIYEGEMAGRLV